ncbi:MAG TPA: hypothetical protein VL463_36575 [Kofleriaceae bacterium]|jgi:hypothetical protein|nr:hypothetical protein [Kofleriaceae bacterium]
MKSMVIASLLALTGVAAADDGADQLVRARISGGPDAPAPGMGASIQGGWGGAHAQAIGAITAEALVAGRITVRAGVQYDAGKSRPSASASYVITDPYASAVGVLVGVAYKPEGLTEPEGEMEGTVALSRLVGSSLASASITYGQDPDFNEHDGELALSMIDPIAKHAAIGGVTRARSGLGSTTDLGARWDGLAGAVGRVQIDDYVITAVAGTEVIGVTTGGTKFGVLGTIALGAWF